MENNYFALLANDVKKLWNGLDDGQKLGMLALIVITIVAATFFLSKAMEPDWVVLYSDLNEVNALTIVDNMKSKHSDIKCNRANNTRIYTLENEDGDILGLTCIDDLEKNVEVRFIESRCDHRYKYVGQNLLASLGQGVLNGRQNRLIIRSAVASAFDFYEKVCGFKDIGKSDLEMNRFDIHKFIKRTEERTQTSMVNFRA